MAVLVAFDNKKDKPSYSVAEAFIGSKPICIPINAEEQLVVGTGRSTLGVNEEATLLYEDRCEMPVVSKIFYGNAILLEGEARWDDEDYKA
jgi:hypothetical protein